LTVRVAKADDMAQKVNRDYGNCSRALHKLILLEMNIWGLFERRNPGGSPSSF
jgi:hypothetical protein